MLTRNEKEICSTIFQFSSVFSSKFLYFCRGCFLNLLPSPCSFLSLFLLLLWHTTRVVPQQNRSRVLGLKCIMDETTRPIVVYLKDTYVSVSAPATHTHTQSLTQKGHRLRVAPATCHLLKQYQTDPRKKRSASSVSPSLPLHLLPHKVK